MHSLPVWSSIDAFNAMQPSPSQVGQPRGWSGEYPLSPALICLMVAAIAAGRRCQWQCRSGPATSASMPLMRPPCTPSCLPYIHAMQGRFALLLDTYWLLTCEWLPSQSPATRQFWLCYLAPATHSTTPAGLPFVCALLANFPSRTWPAVAAHQPTYSIESHLHPAATRIMHFIWLVTSVKPPLYAAAPLQLWGLWRIRGRDMCSAAIMQFPVMQSRTGGC